MATISENYIRNIQTIVANWTQLLYLYQYFGRNPSDRQRLNMGVEECEGKLSASWRDLLLAFRHFVPGGVIDTERHPDWKDFNERYWQKLGLRKQLLSLSFYRFDRTWLDSLWRSLGALADLPASQEIGKLEKSGQIPSHGDIQALPTLLASCRGVESESRGEAELPSISPILPYLLADEDGDIQTQPF